MANGWTEITVSQWAPWGMYAGK